MESVAPVWGRYMEVFIMLHQIVTGGFAGHLLRFRLAGGAVLLAFCLMAGGCGDMLTWSQESRAEGIKALDQKDYTTAAGDFRNAVKQEPRDFRSHYYLGYCYQQLGQYPMAVQSYRSGLGVMQIPVRDTEEAGFRNKMIDGLAQVIAQHDAGDIQLNAAEADAKNHPSAENWMLVSKIYRYRGDVELAASSYRAAAIADSSDFGVQKEAGLYLLNGARNPQDARPLLRRANALQPTDMEVAAALRQIDVVPGPSLKDDSELARPIIPRGPIPELDLSKVGIGSPKTASDSPAGGGSGSAGVPRD